MAVNEQAEKAKIDYLAGMKYKDIAEKYEVSINTVNSWKKRHGWCREGAPKNGAPKSKIGAPIGNQNAKGHGAPLNNKNGLGNKGGPPPHNANAMTHGLFAKFLPPETLEIAKELAEVSPIDILWGNICLKYAAILRAQKVMYVENHEDLTKVLKRQKSGDSSWEEEYELQFAWDKQATFLKAQSTAMTALTNMLKQYEELCRSEMATEEQRLRVDKLRAEVETLRKGGDDSDGVSIIDDIGDDGDDE
ncbi:phage terminase small subunit [Propionispira raffinosivorans]|uniref:phage terminase small subunit n=1 Tax=Propionispira raffinosivorans TaxID=86959 RepID=UPI00036E0AC1|nr:phage terminase small subunit [Propionispira raffinosivorans]